MTGESDTRMAQAGNRITDIDGITVGHHHRIDAEVTVGGGGPDDPPGTGWCSGTTVIRIDGPRPCAAVDVRGGGPGTRETDLLDPANTVTTAHAVVLTGGSAYGLAAADGVMSELERTGVGLPMDAHGHVVPIVPAAVIFDLPVGAVIDPDTGLPWGVGQSDLARLGLQRPAPAEVAALADVGAKPTVLNTTIGVVATDAAFAPASLRRVAMSAHDGLALAIRPVHSPLDGDTIFAVTTGAHPVAPTPAIPPGMNPDTAVLAQVCAVATEVTRDAVVAAIVAAEPVAGIPAYRRVMASAVR